MPIVTNNNEGDLDKRTSNLGPGGSGGSNHPTGPNNTPSSGHIPSTGGVTPPSTAAQIEAAQNAGITGTPQRRGAPGESEIPPNVPPPPSRPPIVDVRTPPLRPFDVFGEIGKSEIRPRPEIGVNFFLDIDSDGFSLNKSRLNTDFKLNDFGAPKRELINILDKKGDFSQVYSSTDKAGEVFRNESLIEQKDFPTTLFLDRKGDFVPKFNERITAPNTFFAPSRLIELSETRIFDGNKTLDDYYERVDNTRDRLSIRRTRGGGDGDVPRVIRKIGERWGEDTFNIPFNVSDKLQQIVDGTNEIAEELLGRNPAVYIDKFQSEVTRLSPLLTSFYTLKQSALQKRAPFKYPTSVKYAFNNSSGLKNITIESELTSLYQEASTLIDPRGYNPLSIFSAPGVFHINRHSTILDPITLIRKAPIGALALAGIAGHVSAGAIAAAAKQSPKVVKNVIEIGKAGLGVIGGAIAGMNLDKSPLFQSDSKFGKFLGSLGNSAKNIASSVQKIDFTKFSTKGLINGQFAKFGAIDAPLLEAGAKLVGGALETGVKIAQAGAEFARDTAGEIINATGKAGKAALSKVDLRAFANVGVDYVNLIKYGMTEYEGKSYDRLDLIPFKFHDIRHDAPIVFRAILSGITDTFTPEYSTERYVGRPDNVYVYQGTDREISFTFDTYPKSDVELITLWQKINYLAGLTYPHVSAPGSDGGRGMISPYTRLTIGEMYNEAPGVITGLTVTVMDETTWETDFAKLPKYCQISVTFAYIGDKVMSAEQQLYDLPSVPSVEYKTSLKSPVGEALQFLKTGDTSAGRITAFSNVFNDPNKSKKDTIAFGTKAARKLLGDFGLG